MKLIYIHAIVRLMSYKMRVLRADYTGPDRVAPVLDPGAQESVDPTTP